MTSSYCGTDTGYTYHRRNGEPTCQRCRDAHTRAEKAREAAAQRRAYREARHGTEAGFKAHAALGTPVCDPCLDVACAIEASIHRMYLEGYRRRTAAMIRAEQEQAA